MADFNSDHAEAFGTTGPAGDITVDDVLPTVNVAGEDATPPSLSMSLPTGAIAPGDLIQVTADDVESPVRFLGVWVVYSDGSVELACEVRGLADFIVGEPFNGAFGIVSTGNGFTVDILRGYPSFSGWGRGFTLRALAIDDYGNVATLEHEYTLTPNPAAPPAVSFLPLTGATFGYTVAVEVDITDSVDGVDPSEVSVYAQGADGVVEVLMLGGVAQSAYSVTETPIGGGTRYRFERTGGWWSDSLAVIALAKDFTGNLGSGLALYTIDPAPPPPDSVAPVVGSVSPAPGTPITATTPISFDVTDDQGTFRRVLVGVEIAGVVELAHDGESFLGNYAGGGCTRDPIAGGFRFTLLRDGGWPSSPTARIWAIDLRGNEA